MRPANVFSFDLRIGLLELEEDVMEPFGCFSAFIAMMGSDVELQIVAAQYIRERS